MTMTTTSHSVASITTSDNNRLPVRPGRGRPEKNTHAAIHYRDRNGLELTSVLLNGAEIRKALYEGRHSPKEIRATVLTADYELITAIVGHCSWVLNSNVPAKAKGKQGSKLYVRFSGNPKDAEGRPMPKTVSRFIAELMAREQTAGTKGLDQLPQGTLVTLLDGNPLNLVRTNLSIKLPREHKRTKSKVIAMTSAREIKGVASTYGRQYPGRDPQAP